MLEGVGYISSKVIYLRLIEGNITCVTRAICSSDPTCYCICNTLQWKSSLTIVSVSLPSVSETLQWISMKVCS